MNEYDINLIFSLTLDLKKMALLWVWLLHFAHITSSFMSSYCDNAFLHSIIGIYQDIFIYMYIQGKTPH